MPSNVLSADNLNKLGVSTNVGAPIDDDALSQFSVATLASDIGPIENVLDLKLSSVEFDRLKINETLGMRDALPSAI